VFDLGQVAAVDDICPTLNWSAMICDTDPVVNVHVAWNPKNHPLTVLCRQTLSFFYHCSNELVAFVKD
jgi:hypothetical protein